MFKSAFMALREDASAALLACCDVTNIKTHGLMAATVPFSVPFCHFRYRLHC
jgi:hypothetical protein